MKNIGLVGLGHWGKNVLRNLYELELLGAACDADPAALRKWRKQYPGPNYSVSFSELLISEEITAVAIASPAATHYEYVRQALAAGKDVYVEKPLALSAAEGEELVKLAERNGRILMVGHILQYHPAVLKLKEIIRAGKLGKVQYIYSNRLNIGKLRTEENILWSFAPHDISVILMLLEQEPKEVVSFGGDYLNRGVYDTTMTTLDFGYARAHIFVNWLHPFKEQKLVVVGSEGMAVFDDTAKEKLVLHPHKIEWREGRIPVARKAERKVVPLEEKEPLREELAHFAECVSRRTTPRTDGREGLRVLRILERAEASLMKRKRKLPDLASASVHETAVVDAGVTIGAGTRIWHFSHVLAGSRIGRNCVIGQNAMIGPDATVGNRCKVQNNVSIYKGVTLEDEVFCGPSCVFTNVYNPRAFIERKSEFQPTLVKRGATLGANATIVCGITIGCYAMVGAGAVVKEDVADHAVVAGVPAKQVGWACRCGTTLKVARSKGTCHYCGSAYKVTGKRLTPLDEKG